MDYMPLYVRPYRAQTDRGVVIIVSTTWERARGVLSGMRYEVQDLRGLDPVAAPATWTNVRSLPLVDDEDEEDW